MLNQSLAGGYPETYPHTVGRCKSCVDFEQRVVIGFDDGSILTLELSPDGSNYTALVQNPKREGVVEDIRRISYRRDEQGWQQLVADCDLTNERLNHFYLIEAELPQLYKPEECKPYLDANRVIEITYLDGLMKLSKDGQVYRAEVWDDDLFRDSPGTPYTSVMWEQMLISLDFSLQEWMEYGDARVLAHH